MICVPSLVASLSPRVGIFSSRSLEGMLLILIGLSQTLFLSCNDDFDVQASVFDLIDGGLPICLALFGGGV